MEDMKKDLVNTIEKYGRDVNVRGMMTREITCYNFLVTDVNFHLSAEEKEYVDNKIKKYSKEIKKCIKTLKEDRFSRRAVIEFSQKDNPPECFLNIHFLIREEELYTIVSQRSLDINKHLKTDVVIAKKFSDAICENLNVKLKHIKFNVNSAHIYK